MDGLMLSSLVGEWQQFVGCRIDKIHQPSQRELVLTVRGREGTKRLLLSAHRRFFRAHQLREQRPSNPQDPPLFCQLARKRIEGGRITRICQQGLDRILELYIESRNELGDQATFVLILELMGKHSNLILCEADVSGRPTKIVDSIVRVTPDMSRVRTVLPGGDYTLPPNQHKVTLANLSPADVEQLEWGGPSQVLAKQLPRLVAGIGPTTAEEVLFRAGQPRVQEPAGASTVGVAAGASSAGDAVGAFTAGVAAAFVAELKALWRGMQEGAGEATLGLDGLGRPLAAAPYPLLHCAAYNTYPSFDAALEAYYLELAVQTETGQLHRELKRQLELALDRLRAKETKLRRELAKGEDYDSYRLYGELLTAYADQVERGSDSVNLPNFYDEERLVNIPLNPAKTAIQNGQEYFRQAGKRKRAQALVQDELESVRQDTLYLENCLFIVQNATHSEAESLQEELVEQSFLKARDRKRKGNGKRETKPKGEQPLQFESSAGFRLLVGKNNKQNDWLTFHKSQPHDTWLHVKDQPGSHVIIVTQGREVPQETLEEAAMLAAYYSKGRDSSNVAVDYTEVRFVWQPNKARPGFALYKNQRTLFVTPDRNVIKRLEAQANPSAPK